MNDHEYLRAEPKLLLARKLKIVVWVVTVTVWALVAFMRRPEKIPLPNGITLDFLPAVHATLNTLVAGLLIVALVMIKRKNIRMHKLAVTTAMLCSAVFLVCYVAYHFTTGETRYGGQGLMKTVYLVLLISHIVLAAISLPMILLNWTYGITNQFQKHRSLSKWVFPVWLYVAATGPICYLMLRPYYD